MANAQVERKMVGRGGDFARRRTEKIALAPLNKVFEKKNNGKNRKGKIGWGREKERERERQELELEWELER